MKRKIWLLYFLSLAALQFVLLLPSFTEVSLSDQPVGVYNVSDIALTPGSDAAKLNIAWHAAKAHQDKEGAIKDEDILVKVAKKQHDQTGGKNFPKNTSEFKGKIVGSLTDENGTSVYSYEAAVTGLEENTPYLYVLGDGKGGWSEIYEYVVRNPNKYGFIYLADSQVGSSVPMGATPEKAAEAVANDTKGWANTVKTIDKYFPDAAFILSGGDQVEIGGEEIQWTGFFSPPELTSMPVAPTIASHDEYPNGRERAIKDTLPNFGYHFNLPNESKVSGVSNAGGDYYFTYGNVLYMVLNMDPTLASYPMSQPGQNCDPDASVDCSDHQAFMSEAIASNPHARWKIVMWHYSIYSAGMHASDCSILALRKAMVPVIDSLDIDVVFMGHDHCFARSYQMLGDKPRKEQTIGEDGAIVNPTGTLYFTANSSSGSKYYNIHNNVGTFEYLIVYSQDYKPTFSYLEVDNNRLSISTYIAETMKMIDTYVMVKRTEK